MTVPLSDLPLYIIPLKLPLYKVISYIVRKRTPYKTLTGQTFSVLPDFI